MSLLKFTKLLTQKLNFNSSVKNSLHVSNRSNSRLRETKSSKKFQNLQVLRLGYSVRPINRFFRSLNMKRSMIRNEEFQQRKFITHKTASPRYYKSLLIAAQSSQIKIPSDIIHEHSPNYLHPSECKLKFYSNQLKALASN